MIRHLLTRTILRRFSSTDHHQINRQQINLRQEKSGYYLDPSLVARRVMRVIALHNKIQHPQLMTLNTQWHELGISALDFVEIMFAIEDQFKIEFDDVVMEKFKDINDAVEYVGRSFFAQ